MHSGVWNGNMMPAMALTESASSFNHHRQYSSLATPPSKGVSAPRRHPLGSRYPSIASGASDAFSGANYS
jgi:hypothetical protein